MLHEIFSWFLTGRVVNNNIYAQNCHFNDSRTMRLSREMSVTGNLLLSGTVN